MRRALFVRILLSMLVGVAAAALVSELAFRLQDQTTSRAPQVVELVIPAGAAERTAAGETVLPPDMIFVTGDTLVVRNQDSVPHTLGPLYVPPGASASLALDYPASLALTCSFQPTRTFGLDVRQALTLGTRIQGFLIAGLPLGVLIAVYSLVAWPLPKK